MVWIGVISGADKQNVFVVVLGFWFLVFGFWFLVFGFCICWMSCTAVLGEELTGAFQNSVLSLVGCLDDSQLGTEVGQLCAEGGHGV